MSKEQWIDENEKLKDKIKELEAERDKWKRLFQEANETLSEIYEEAK